MIDLSEFQEVAWVQAKPILVPGMDHIDCYCELGLRNGEKYEFGVYWDAGCNELKEAMPAHAWHNADDFLFVKDDKYLEPEVQAVREILVSRMKQIILTYRLTGIRPGQAVTNDVTTIGRSSPRHACSIAEYSK